MRIRKCDAVTRVRGYGTVARIRGNGDTPLCGYESVPGVCRGGGTQTGCGMKAFEGFTAMERFLALTRLVGVPGMTGGESAGEGMSKCWRGRCMLRVTAAAAPTTLITFPVSFKLSLPETGGPSSGPELRV